MDLPLHASRERDHITMMRTMTVVRQYLAAAFLIVIGLIAYGCGDSATVNPEVALNGLTVSTETATVILDPPFNPATTSYTANLTSGTERVTIAASPAVSGDTITIDGQQTFSLPIALNPPGGTPKVVQIVVSESTSKSRTYTVTLNRAGVDTSLSALSVSIGTQPPLSLAPSFDPNIVRYAVGVANDITSVTVSATKSDPNTVMQIGSVIVEAGTATGQAIVPLNGTGAITPISIEVTASNGTRRSYTVDVTRGPSPNNNLQSLTISPGTLNFKPTITSYPAVNVGSTVTSVTVRPTLQDTTATMTVNGQSTNSGQTQTIPLGAPNSTTPIIIIVTAQNGTQKPYTIGVIRAALSGNNNLSALTVSPGALDPAFSVNTTSYTVDVGSGVTSISITPTLQDTTATMTVNGQAATSGQARAIPLNGAGSNTLINIVVTAPNGTQKTYTVNVSRAALGGNNNLSALTVSPGALNPAFNASTLNYTVNVGSAVTNVTVSATKADPNAVMSEDVTAPAGTATGQATIPLGGPGTTTPVLINVTAPNGSQKTYAITVNRAALGSNNNLSALTVSPGALNPAFNASTLNYTVNVGSAVTNVTVSATKADPNAVMSGDVTAGTGQATGQATIPLDGPGTSKNVSITVTAPNGSQKTYLITANRAALGSNNNLSELTVSPGALDPTFDANTLIYTVNVGSAVTNVTVSATKADPNAVLSGSVTAGTGVPTGQATIPLNGAGSSTPVSITVTAPNGSSKTYSITINRAAGSAPPAPTSAPDLTPESDSGISQTDNITNDLTPSFFVAPLAAGETPNLYINGSKVKEGFDLGTNTLTPTNPLPGGDYFITVTSTVVNAAGLESPQSLLSLSVHIDNVAPAGGP